MYNINTLFTSSCLCLNTYVLCTLHVLQLRTYTVSESLSYSCGCNILTFSTIYQRTVPRVQPERAVRNPSQEQVAVSRGGKGKQVQHEMKISNPVHVSGFEAHHGTSHLDCPLPSELWCPQEAFFCHRECSVFNPLNAKSNPICHLLALLGTHHILHISRIRVNHITFTSIFVMLWKKD